MLDQQNMASSWGCERGIRRIALCDDDPVFLENMSQLVNEYLPEQGMVHCFTNGLDLLRFCEKEPPHLIFLDIQMPGLDGLHIARELRKFQPFITIVIVTHYREFALQGYDIRAFDYLVKPISRQKVKRIIDELYLLPFAKEKHFFIFNKTKIFLPPLDSLLYFESCGRLINAYPYQGCYSWYGKLGELERQLPRQFVRTHRSFIVNLHWIKEIDKSRRQLLLMNGQSLPISKSLYIKLLKEVEGWSY